MVFELLRENNDKSSNSDDKLENGSSMMCLQHERMVKNKRKNEKESL